MQKEGRSRSKPLFIVCFVWNREHPYLGFRISMDWSITSRSCKCPKWFGTLTFDILKRSQFWRRAIPQAQEHPAQHYEYCTTPTLYHTQISGCIRSAIVVHTEMQLEEDWPRRVLLIRPGDNFRVCWYSLHRHQLVRVWESLKVVELPLECLKF